MSHCVVCGKQNWKGDHKCKHRTILEYERRKIKEQRRMEREPERTLDDRLAEYEELTKEDGI